MYKSSCVLIAALAAASALPVAAAGAAPGGSVAGGHVRAPAAVGASDCVAGGGLIIVAWEGPGEAFSQYCRGGAHDGETVV